MAAVEDLKRRYGVGWGGVFLYMVLLAGGIAVAEILGDVPTGGAGRGAPPRTLVPGLVFGLGLLGVVLAASNLPTYLRLIRTETAGTGDVTEASGRVVLKGTVEKAGGALTTPVEGKESVAYTTRVLKNSHDDVEQARESEKNWSAVHVGEEATRFVLDDGTGPATVGSDEARLYLQDKEEKLFASGSSLPGSVKEYLREVGAEGDTDGTHLRIEEKSLEPGEKAFVVGKARDAKVDATLVAEGDHAGRVRGRILNGAVLGGVVAALGYLGLLVVAGAV
jgi:hypothetical protein